MCLACNEPGSDPIAVTIAAVKIKARVGVGLGKYLNCRPVFKIVWVCLLLCLFVWLLVWEEIRFQLQAVKIVRVSFLLCLSDGRCDGCGTKRFCHLDKVGQ